MKTRKLQSLSNFGTQFRCIFRLFLSYVVILFVFLGSSCSGIPEKTFVNVKSERQQKASPKYDVIVVPGIPYKEEGWSWIMKTRICWAKILYDKGITRKIMFSGGAVYTPYSEAKIMALYAEAIGIPSDAILIETKAEHSVENIYFSYLKAKSMGFERIALATDPFQCLFLRKFIKQKVDPNIDFLPIGYRQLELKFSDKAEPSIEFEKAYLNDFVSIIERDSKDVRRSRSRGENLLPIRSRSFTYNYDNAINDYLNNN